MPKTCGHFGDGHWPAPTVLAKNRINEAGLSLTLADEFTPGIHESGFTLAQLRQPGPTARSEPISGRLRAAHPAPDGKIVHGVGPVTTVRVTPRRGRDGGGSALRCRNNARSSLPRSPACDPLGEALPVSVSRPSAPAPSEFDERKSVEVRRDLALREGVDPDLDLHGARGSDAFENVVFPSGVLRRHAQDILVLFLRRI